MPNFTVQMDEDEYRIVSDTGEESELVPYGAAAMLRGLTGSLYYCWIADPDNEDPVVVQITGETEQPTKQEDVIFKTDEAGTVTTGDEPDEGEDEEEDEEEDEDSEEEEEHKGTPAET